MIDGCTLQLGVSISKLLPGVAPQKQSQFSCMMVPFESSASVYIYNEILIN